MKEHPLFKGYYSNSYYNYQYYVNMDGELIDKKGNRIPMWKNRRGVYQAWLGDSFNNNVIYPCTLTTMPIMMARIFDSVPDSTPDEAVYVEFKTDDYGDHSLDNLLFGDDTKRVNKDIRYKNNLLKVYDREKHDVFTFGSINEASEYTHVPIFELEQIMLSKPIGTMFGTDNRFAFLPARTRKYSLTEHPYVPIRVKKIDSEGDVVFDYLFVSHWFVSKWTGGHNSTLRNKIIDAYPNNGQFTMETDKGTFELSVPEAYMDNYKKRYLYGYKNRRPRNENV